MLKTTLTIRIPTELKQDIVSAARADDRLVTSFVIKALRVAIDDRVGAKVKAYRGTKG